MKLFLLTPLLLLLLLPGCTLTNQHGSVSFHPSHEMLEVISSNQQTTNRAIQIMDRLETKLDRHTP